LADVAPTVLHFMGISFPEQMTGKNLVTTARRDDPDMGA
jgi:bisphosphoglycerate-independent phosphoglycerate mutase (AlkP superfamily)